MMPWSTLQGRSAVRWAVRKRGPNLASSGTGRRSAPSTLSTGARTGDINPGVAVALFAGKGSGVDARGVEMVVARERRNQLAASAAGFKLPAVVAAGDAIAVEPAFAERNAAMRATVAHRKNAAIAAAAQHQRKSEQHRRCQLAFAQRVGAQRRDTSRHRSGWRWGPGSAGLDRHSGFVVVTSGMWNKNSSERWAVDSEQWMGDSEQRTMTIAGKNFLSGFWM